MTRSKKKSSIDPSPSGSSIITLKQVKELAGTTYFKRGEKYFHDRAVRSLVEYNGGITATVHGTLNYNVRIARRGKELEYRCSCPLGYDGEFCKHCVAVALAWLDAREKNEISHGGFDTLAEILAGMKQEELVRIIIEEAERNPALRNRLLAGTVRELNERSSREEWLAMVDRLTELGGNYNEIESFRAGLDTMVEMLASLAKRKESAAMAIELIEHAIARLDDLAFDMEEVVPDLAEILHNLHELHLAACRVGRPDPIALAERLFSYETEQNFDTYHPALERYDTVLGAEGRGRYRELAHEAWEKVPSAKSTWGRMYDDRDMRLMAIMESLARASRDVEDVARIREKYLANISDYLDLAMLYKRAGNDAKAIEWAERGRKEFANTAAIDLREFLIREYTRLGMHDELMRLLLETFNRYPSLESYKEVKARGEKMGVWEKWREKTLDLARKGVARAPKRGRKPPAPAQDNSLIVEILLWENEVDAAWQEAIEGDCSDRLWSELAAACEKSRPEDAIAIYQTLVEKHMDMWQQYPSVVDILKRLERLMRIADRENEFIEYLDEIRATAARKRKLMELIDEAFPSGSGKSSGGIASPRIKKR